MGILKELFKIYIISLAMLSNIGYCEIVVELYKIECDVVNKTYMENLVCEIKSVGRGAQVLNIYGDLLVTLEEVFIMNVELTSKTSTNVFKNAVFNVSANLCGNAFETPLIKMIQPLTDQFAPGFIHECPYLPKKDFGIHNMVVDSALIPLMSLATFDRIDYRVRITYQNKQKQFVVKIIIYLRFGPKKIKRKTTTKAPSD